MNHDYFHTQPLSEVLAMLVDESGMPLKAIAAEIGKPYTILYRELDANDDGAKIGVDTAFLLIRACYMEGSRLGSWPPKTPPPPLMWLASKCGFRCGPVVAEPDHGSIQEELLDDLQAVAAMQAEIRKRKMHPAKVLELVRRAQIELEESGEQYRREWEKE